MPSIGSRSIRPLAHTGTPKLKDTIFSVLSVHVNSHCLEICSLRLAFTITNHTNLPQNSAQKWQNSHQVNFISRKVRNGNTVICPNINKLTPEAADYICFQLGSLGSLNNRGKLDAVCSRKHFAEHPDSDPEGRIWKAHKGLRGFGALTHKGR